MNNSSILTNSTANITGSGEVRPEGDFFRFDLQPNQQPHQPLPLLAAPMEHLRTRFSDAALYQVRLTPEPSSPELDHLIEQCINPTTLATDNRIFSTHPWLDNEPIDDQLALFLSTWTQHLTHHFNSAMQVEGESNREIELNTERQIKEAIQETFAQLPRSFTLNEPIKLFIYDTETDRLFGDAISIGWVAITIEGRDKIEVEARNAILPPATMSYGAERIHTMSLEWLRNQHADQLTTSPKETARQWLQHVLNTQSAIGFNVKYDLDTLKRLFHRVGVRDALVEKLFNKIGQHFSIDAQDYLLRVDYETRHQHQLPFQDTTRHHEIAESLYENRYSNGEPIEYLPNRKLVSYAKGFLNLNTDAAHDALYDCVMTLGGLLKSVALRNEILEHETAFTRKADRRLTEYSRLIKPSSPLSRKIFQSESAQATHQGNQSAYKTFTAQSDPLPNNPALRSSPFIFLPTAGNHRRHIIPKSTLASLVHCNGDRRAQAALFTHLLNQPTFTNLFSRYLSTSAKQFCENLLSSRHSETKECAIQFLKAFENAQSKHGNIRYFERGTAKNMISNLPSSEEITRLLDAPLPTESINAILSVITYSLMHALEFNQFIGSGAENIVAGESFHFIAANKEATFQELESAEDIASLEETMSAWFDELYRSIKLDAIANSQNAMELDSIELVDQNDDRNLMAPDATHLSADSARRVSQLICNDLGITKLEQDSILLFMEKVAIRDNLLSAFYHQSPPSIGRSTDGRSAARGASLEEQKREFLGKFDILEFIVNARHKNRNIFPDRDWLTPISNAITRLQQRTTRSRLENGYHSVDEALSALEQSALYQKDRELLATLTKHLFSEHSLYPDLINLETDPQTDNLSTFQPWDSNASALENSKRSLKAFINSVYDSTAYDLPKNPAGPLQNSYLLPLYSKIAQLQSEQPSDIAAAGDALGEKNAQLLLQLLLSDQHIESDLNTSRATFSDRSLFAPYIDFLYG